MIEAEKVQMHFISIEDTNVSHWRMVSINQLIAIKKSKLASVPEAKQSCSFLLGTQSSSLPSFVGH